MALEDTRIGVRCSFSDLVLPLGGLPGARDIVEGLPPLFLRLIDRMMVSNIFPEHQRPNHVLINEYKDGCGTSPWYAPHIAHVSGLIPHDDGPLYEPVVAVISLGTAILNYWEKASNGQGTRLLTHACSI